MRIIIDADACPKTVLEICIRMGCKYKIPVWTVASFNHNIISDHHIVVDSGSQQADIKIVNTVKRGDVVITQDWGLAAIVLSKKSYCLSPSGRIYTEDKMNFLLEEREIKAKFRRGGGRTKGPNKRTGQDDRIFELCLEKILVEVSSKTV